MFLAFPNIWSIRNSNANFYARQTKGGKWYVKGDVARAASIARPPADQKRCSLATASWFSDPSFRLLPARPEVLSLHVFFSALLCGIKRMLIFFFVSLIRQFSSGGFFFFFVTLSQEFLDIQLWIHASSWSTHLLGSFDTSDQKRWASTYLIATYLETEKPSFYLP